MISPSFPSQEGINLARKFLVLMLVIASAPSITSLSVPVSAETPTEEQMILLEEILALLEPAYSNTSMLLEYLGDNESLPMAFELLQLGKESAMIAFSLNATGSYTEAYYKAMEALEYYRQAIITANLAEPEPGDPSSPENSTDPMMVQGALERTWDYLDEVNSTYQDQGADLPEVEALISQAFALLQDAEEMFAEGNYTAAADAVSAASEALNGAMEFLMENCRENKAERAIKFLDIRRNSLNGLEEYITQMQGEVDAEVAEVFLNSRNANQLIRTLIESGEIDEAIDELVEIQIEMDQSLLAGGLTKNEVKELHALERVLIKAERLHEKNINGLEGELTGNGKALGKTDDDGGNGNSNKEKNPKKGKKPNHGNQN